MTNVNDVTLTLVIDVVNQRSCWSFDPSL